MRTWFRGGERRPVPPLPPRADGFTTTRKGTATTFTGTARGWSSPENPERNWLYVTSVNRFLLLYTGEDWEEPAIINSLNKCGWCILGFSALSYHYYND